jgi:hypothetical protein
MNKRIQHACALLLFAALFTGAAAAAGAQTAAALQTLLAAPSVTWAQAARFVLEAAGTPGAENADEQTAFSRARESGWLPRGVQAQDQARLDGVSLLIARSFGVKGGLGFRLFKNAHYAYHELVYRRVIQDRADPSWPVSGSLLLFMVGRMLPDEEPLEPPAPEQT